MLPKEHNTRPERRYDMKDILTGLAIIAALIYAIAVAVVPVHQFSDCKYCGIPTELGIRQADNHWSDDGKVICNDCFVLGHRR